MTRKQKKDDFDTYNWVHATVKTWEDFRRLENLRPLEQTFVAEAARACVKGKLLEIGCSYGRAALRFSQEGFEVTGIDTNLSSIRKFNRFAREQGLAAKAYRKDTMEYDLGEDVWDAIVCEYVLHSLPRAEVDDLLRRIQKATKTTGLNLITVFTDEGDAFGEQPEVQKIYRCLLSRRYLKEIFTKPQFQIIRYIEEPIETKLGGYQITSQIIAQRT